MTPVEIYGRAKLAGELAVRDICTKGNLPLVRDPTAHDSRRRPPWHLQILFQWISGEPKNLRHRRWQPEVPVRPRHDLMDAYMLAMDAGKPGVYNVGAARFGTLREALEHVIAHAPLHFARRGSAGGNHDQHAACA